MKSYAILTTAIAAAALIAAAPASADDRYASVTGGGPIETCPSSDPCGLANALEPTATDDGDTVILEPGVYPVDAPLLIQDAIHVHGTGAPSATKLVSTFPTGSPLRMEHAGAEISNLEVNSESTSAALDAYTGKVYRVIVRSSGGVACATYGASFVQAVCSGTGWNSDALVVTVPSGTVPINLRNVTLIGGIAAYGMRVYSTGGQANVIAIGMIAAGSAGAVFLSGASTTFTATYSNFQSVSQGAATNFTQAGSGTNQTPLPKFVNQVTGDFRQAADSATIDAGGVDDMSGLVDLLGAPRTQGAAPDIGAYEFDPASVVPPPATGGGPPSDPPATLADTTAPTLTISKKPKSKTTKKKLSVAFAASESATFLCKLDKGKFKACKSPYKKTVKLGKHTLQIKATDAAGNVSSTKTIKWTVKAP